MKRVRTILQAGPVGKSCEHKKFIGPDGAMTPKGIGESCDGVMTCGFCESEGSVAPGGGGAASAFADSKPHYALLDGMRGVAALIVIWYHIFEAFATSPVTQRVNHGFLAVDFFYILSGFVIGYAYDDRWNKGMDIKGFFRRRLVRLHPMVVLACILGVISFLIQGSEKWDGTAVPFSCILLAMLMQMLMLPVWPGSAAEIRGGGEMYPLNGPSWSLFFEYIGNILYAFLLRHLSVRKLAAFTVISGAGLAVFALSNIAGTGNLGVGWTFAGYSFPGGMLRMMFSFSAGLLISRVFRPHTVRNAFLLCSTILVVLLVLPYIGDGSRPWLNILYELFCVMAVFPILVWTAASGKISGRISASVCKFLGDISYPLYIIHYPSIYLLFMAARKYGMTFGDAWPYAIAVFAGNIILAWILLKVYDGPVRKQLGRIWLKK